MGKIQTWGKLENPQARNKVKKSAGSKECSSRKMSKKGIIAGDILPLKEKMELFRSDTTDICVGAKVLSCSFSRMWKEGDAKCQPTDLLCWRGFSPVSAFAA